MRQYVCRWKYVVNSKKNKKKGVLGSSHIGWYRKAVKPNHVSDVGQHRVMEAFLLCAEFHTLYAFCPA